jgi:hypothetical protein
MTMHRKYWLVPILLAGVLALLFAIVPIIAANAAGNSYLGQFKTISTVASTVPSNGDVNPYGVAVVPTSIGKLTRNNILVSNFNNSANLQGTGTTIVQITPGGKQSLFAQIDPKKLHGACPGGVGLTTALTVLQRGWVIVGSLPTANGTAATAKAGCLIVLNSWGKVVETFAGQQINGPWDMTAFDQGNYAALFVTNVLNGTVAANGKVVNRGTVLRIEVRVPKQGEGLPETVSTTVVGSGFSERTDPAALVIGPTGVGLGKNDTLYVADTLNNRIAAIPQALTRGNTAFAGKGVTANGALNGPLGLAIAPNGNILTVNSNDGNIVETTPGGKQIATKQLDKTGSPAGAGTLFGLAVVPRGHGVYFVDDGTNTLNLFH